MANRIITVVLVLLIIICGGTGYYAYNLNRQLADLERDISRTADELAAGNAALAEKIGGLEAAAGARREALEALEESAAAARGDIVRLEEQVDGLETALASADNRTLELEARLEAATADMSRAALDASKVYDRVSAATVRISNGENTIGSGFIYDDRHVVTAHHVTDTLSKISVILYDGRVIRASLAGSSQPSDVAVLRLDDEHGLRPPPLGDSGALRVGEPVIAIGSPGIDEGEVLRDTLSTGIVSQVNRFVEIDGSSFANLIQSDVAVNPGNSGGPLYNADAEIIGLVIARVSADFGDGISYAVAANKVQRVAAAILDHGYFDYPWIGIGGVDITPETMLSRNLPDTNGVLVTSVYAGPSLDAGVKPDDIILAIDGIKLRDMDDLACYLGEFKSPGDTAGITLRRGSETLYTELEIAIRK